MNDLGHSMGDLLNDQPNCQINKYCIYGKKNGWKIHLRAKKQQKATKFC